MFDISSVLSDLPVALALSLDPKCWKEQDSPIYIHPLEAEQVIKSPSLPCRGIVFRRQYPVEHTRRPDSDDCCSASFLSPGLKIHQCGWLWNRCTLIRWHFWRGNTWVTRMLDDHKVLAGELYIYSTGKKFWHAPHKTWIFFFFPVLDVHVLLQRRLSVREHADPRAFKQICVKSCLCYVLGWDCWKQRWCCKSTKRYT